jgi:GNAT superfamily N-acetyltransferase
VDIIELEPAAVDLVEGFADLENEAIAVDAPWFHPATVRGVQSRLRYGFDLEPGRFFVAVHDDRVVGSGAVHTSDWDNEDLAWLEVTVAPALRRQGLGAAVHEHVREVAMSMGRTKHGADAWQGSAGVPFAAGLGYEARSKEIHRRQHLDELPMDKVEAMHAEAEAFASAYELVRIAGRTPVEMLDGVAGLAGAINDAPLDDLEIEDEVYSAERVRNYETASIEGGNRLYRIIARHRETGALVGHTIVVVEEERPWIGWQHDTAVARAHRGHRLGLLLKSAMNLWLADLEPQLRTVDTWNAESNDHMIEVNELLGYRWMGRVLAFQRP